MERNRHLFSKIGARLLVSAALCLSAETASADPYERLAKDILAIAKQVGRKRIAVLPFKPINDRSRQAGVIISERMISRLASASGIEVIERALLEEVLAEQKLGHSGVLNQEQAKTVGKILGVDALLTGTYMPLGGDRLEVHTRLIDAESARILGAAQTRLRKEWKDDSFSLGENWDVSAPSVAEFSAPMVKLTPDPFRDAPRNLRACEGWEGQVDSLQQSVLELKARYWAARLLDPSFDRSQITRNPGSDIRSMSLRSRFYDRTKALHLAHVGGGISASEEAQMNQVKDQVDALVDRCY